MEFYFSLKDFLRKAASILTAAFFIFSGIPAPVSFATVHELTPSELRQTAPALTLEQANAQGPGVPNTIPSGAAIMEGRPLSLPFSGTTGTSETDVSTETLLPSAISGLSQPDPVRSSVSYEYERYAFDEAAELLRPEYATAVVLKDLNTDDLRQLANLPFETGILVLHGEIVLFTSGSEDEVGMSLAAKALTDKATFISHTHPGTYSAEGPSGMDLNEAVAAPGREYVITHQGVYAYNDQGLLDGGALCTYDQYLEELQQALEAGKEDRNQVEARKDLNQFIKSQDDYNLAGTDECLAFRMGGTLSYTSGLTTANVTTLSGSPMPYITDGSTVATALSVSLNQFILGCSVPGVSNRSGFTISFDNATTPGTETQDLSELSQITFGLRGPNTSLALEVVDLYGNKDTFTLTNISNTVERFWNVPVSAIADTLDKTKIKQLNFIVTQADTAATARTGTLYIRSSGLNVSVPSLPVVTSVVPLVTGQRMITLSGTKEANTSILINGVQAVPRDAATTWTATANLTIEGYNTLKITAKNSLGKLSLINTITLKRDTVIPTGSINVNAGALYTTSQTVTLNLVASDVLSGIDKMTFSTDNVNWTEPEAYATSKVFDLPAGDGTKTVYVKYYDKVGNISAVRSKAILLDTLPPAGTITVNGGAQLIKQTLVTLNLSAADTGSGLSKMSFSSDGVTWTTAQTYAATRAWTFVAGDGDKRVFVKFQDKAGNWAQPVSVLVSLDTVKPTGSIAINSGAAYAISRDVTLNLSAADAGSGIATMSFSTNNVNWTVAEAYADTKPFTLLAGNGVKTVYVRYYDRAGNVSATLYRSITLDTSVPAGTVNINSGAIYAASPTVTLNLSGTDVGTGISAVSFSTNNTDWTAPVTYATAKTFTLPAGDGTKTVYVRYYDKAGNVSAVYSKSIILDTTAPALTPFDLPTDGRTNIPYYVIPVQVGDVNANNAVEYVTVTLVAGMNHVPVTVRDKAGNQSQITVDLEYVPTGSELTAQAQLLRDQWIDTNSKYFLSGIGIDYRTGFPIDVIGSNAPATARWTQPTSIGFYLQLLSDAITLRVTIPGLTQLAALAAAQKTLTSLLDVQARFGWNGLIPWLRLEGTLRPDRTEFSLIDNANLSHELAVFIGLLETAHLDKTVGASLVQKAQAFLDRQGDGYRAFVDTSGILRGVFDRATNSFSGYTDQFGSEVRATIPFLIGYFGLPDTAWDYLFRSTSSYATQQGRDVQTFSAYDGGAFQYFWSLLVSPEDQLPGVSGALQNAFLIFNDWMERFNLAGFPSAASLPEGGYDGKLGIELLKVTGDAIRGNYASLFGLASAYRLNPSWVITKLQELLTAFPALRGTLGFYDSMRSDGAVSRNYYAIDQGSFVLGLIGTGADDFRSFMEKRGLWAGYAAHYAALGLGIQQVTSALPELPLTQTEIDQRTPDSGNLYTGSYNFGQYQGYGLSVSQTSPGIYTYHKTAPSGWVGGSVSPAFDINDYNYVTVKARNLTGTSGAFTLEIKHGSNFILQKVVSLAGTGWNTIQFLLPKNSDTVNFIAFSCAFSDFEVGDLQFSDVPVFTGPVPAQVVQTSSLFSNTLDYLLTYSLNGALAQEALHLSEGNNTVTRTWTDAIGEKVTRVFSIQADTVAPTGSININAGVPYVKTPNVTLNLSASDATTGVDKMSFSTDNVNWTAPEVYAISKVFTLPAGDGAKTVYVRYYDKAGNVGPIYSKSITLDTTGPTGSITINSGTGYTASTAVTLNLPAQDAASGIDKMSFSINNSTWTTPEVYAASRAFTVSSGDGTKTVYVRYYDKLGNLSSVYSGSVILDTVAPTISSVAVVNIPGNGVTISWLTNEAGDSRIEYGLTTLYGQSTVLDPSLLTSHAQSVNGLAANTLYHYRVRSKDAAGNSRVSGDLTFIAQAPVPAQSSLVSTQAGDRRLFVQNRGSDGTLEPTVAFVAKGVNWSPTSVGTDPTLDPAVFQKEFQKWYQTDIPLMAEMGINVVRVYHDFGTGPDAIKILDALYRYGIKVIVAVDSPLGNVSGDLNNISAVVNAYKNHPAILMWSVGNEWDLNYYYGKFSTLQAAANFTEQVAELIKSLDPNHPVTTFIGDPNIPGVHPLSVDQFPYLPGPYTSDIVNTMVPGVDVWGVNIYRGSSFQDVSQQWKSISQKPMFIGEFGADSYDHRTAAANPSIQSAMDANLWDETFFDLSAERTEGAVIGALGFEWNDEWWKNGSPSAHSVSSETNGGQPDGYNDEEWFGIVDINRNLKPVYTQLQNKFLNGPSSVAVDATPVIQVTSQDGGGASKFGIDSKTVFYRQGGQYGGRGISVAILDPHTGIRMQEVRTFDTWYMSGGWGGSHVNFSALINYLNSLPDGTVYALSIADDGGFRAGAGNGAWSDPNVEAAYQALEALGSTMIRNVGYQGGWAMIGVKGQGKLAENYSAPGTAVTIQAQVSITPDPNFGRR